MQLTMAFFTGFLLGGLAVRWLMMRADRLHTRPHVRDEQYAAAKRAAARHFKRHDTLNLAEMERLMDISGVTAMRYLDQMERDKLLKLQGHRSKGAFYTRPS